jgi:hypothetical protein
VRLEVNVRQRDAPSGALSFGFRIEDERMSDGTLRIEDAVNETCPWSGKPIAADSLTLYRGEVVGFCNPGCRDKFEAAISHFEKALAKSDVPLIAKGIE